MRKIIPYTLILLFFSCKKNEPLPSPDAYEDGILVLNEGLFQQNNASLSFYSVSDAQEFQQCFLAENERGLGDTANDFEKFSLNGKDFVIIAVDVSSQLEIVEALTLKSVVQIPVLNGSESREPRHVVVKDTKAYSSNFDGTVSVVNLLTNSIEKTISVGRNPDGMIIRGDALYVANSGGLDAPNYDSTVSVIDLNSETVVQTIDARINLGEMCADGQGELYVHSKGNYSDVNPAWVRISPSNEVLAIYERNFTAWTYSNDRIYYYDMDAEGIYRFNTITETFDSDQLIDCSSYDIPYSITVRNNYIYVSDANGYVNSSTIHCYDLNGNEQYQFTAGLNANEIIINE